MGFSIINDTDITSEKKDALQDILNLHDSGWMAKNVYEDGVCIIQSPVIREHDNELTGVTYYSLNLCFYERKCVNEHWVNLLDDAGVDYSVQGFTPNEDQSYYMDDEVRRENAEWAAKEGVA
jgi:hypothetical protein